MKKTLKLLLLLLCCPFVVGAAPRTKEEMKSLAQQAIAQQCSARRMAPRFTPLKVLFSMEEMDIIGYDEGGFAVVAADDLLPAVLGVSTNRYSQGANPNFEWWLQGTAAAARQAVRSHTPLHVTRPDTSMFPESVESMVTAKWYQDQPYNRMCPTFSGTVKCLTGCVATSMAQILHYHKLPQHGFGQRTIYYPKGRTSGEAVTADFENDYYDWANMLDIYTPGRYSDTEADAVALLMRDCGVAANMEYGGPNEGSGAYSDQAAMGLREYFGFEEAQCLERDYYSEKEWMNIIYREISQNGPVYYGGADMMMGGHAFLFDGYDESGRVSVNWGWAGEDDGYFYISQLNPSFYHFSYAQDMIIGIKGMGSAQRQRTVSVTLSEAGQLASLPEIQDDESPIVSLTIEGPLNEADFACLRQLAGDTTSELAVAGALRILDLSKAKLEQKTLPDSALKNCISLRRLRLPETVAYIGKGAFSGCTALNELRVTAKSVPQLLGEDTFSDMPMRTATLYVCRGLKKQYTQTDQWKLFGEKRIFEVGISVKVRNVARNYGESNPNFTFTVEGGTITGTPQIDCEASKHSPAGVYPLHISPGTVTNSEAVNFIDGYIIVQKVNAKATVKDAERYVGEPNPEFTLSYTGMITGERMPSWTEEPVFSTSATASSKPGVYSIYVRSGSAESYNLTFLPGKLTVKAAPTGIEDAPSLSDSDHGVVYDLQGRRVNDSNSQRGLYIRNGKKILK
jgi:hypothetical protein